jgi:hypothetical protein
LKLASRFGGWRDSGGAQFADDLGADSFQRPFAHAGQIVINHPDPCRQLACWRYSVTGLVSNRLAMPISWFKFQGR